MCVQYFHHEDLIKTTGFLANSVNTVYVYSLYIKLFFTLQQRARFPVFWSTIVDSIVFWKKKPLEP
jgi:hypothetical protein